MYIVKEKKTTSFGLHCFLSPCMKSPHVRSSLQSVAITPCLAHHSSNTRALEKLISCSSEGTGFFCQPRSQVNTIIAGKLCLKIYNAHLIYMSFSWLAAPILLNSLQCYIRALSIVYKGNQFLFLDALYQVSGVVCMREKEYTLQPHTRPYILMHVMWGVKLFPLLNGIIDINKLFTKWERTFFFLFVSHPRSIPFHSVLFLSLSDP